MNFPKYSCLKIVNEISLAIGEQINMMDHEGIIIASTDASRIGTFHAGAKRIIDEKLNSLVIRSDDEYIGAKPGINLPIEFQNEIVGVIGVTGPEKTVGEYGKIIKKMTEILFLDISMRREIDIEQRIRTRYLNDWIRSAPEVIDRRMAESGLQIGVDIIKLRRVALISVMARQEPSSVALQRDIDAAENGIRKVIAAMDDAIVFKSGSTIVGCFHNMSDEQMLAAAGSLKADVEKNPALVACVGIDDAVQDYTHINTAYRHAQKALRTCIRSPHKEPRLYSSVNLEIFSGEIPDTAKLEYIRRIFSNCTLGEIVKWIRLLDMYYSCEGSLADTAKSLFIHKNTLQYRLKQIHDKTGYDPRSIRFSSLFYIAIHFFSDIRGKIQFDAENGNTVV